MKKKNLNSGLKQNSGQQNTEQGYTYTLENDFEKASKLKKNETLSNNGISVEEEEVEGEAAEDSSAPLTVKENFLKKLQQKKGGLLNSLRSEVEEEAEAYSFNKNVLPWTLENLQQTWEEHISAIDSPSSQILYKSAQLHLHENSDILSITVKSSRAKDAVSRDTVLLEKIRKSYKKPDLKFDIQIEETAAEEIVKPKAKPISDRDKYSYFMQMNPLLADFQKRFGLFPPDYNPKKK